MEIKEAVTMEFFLEIFLTAFLSLLFALLFAKLVSIASAGDVDEHESVLRSGKKFDGEVVTEDRIFKGKLKNRGLGTLERVEFVGEAVKVDEFETDLVQEKVEMVHVVSEERMFKGESKDRELETGERIEFVGEAMKVDEFEAELVQEKLGTVHGVEEFVKEGCEVEFCENDRIGVEEEALEEGVKVLGLLEEKFVVERPDKKEAKASDSDLGEVEKEEISNEDDRMEDSLVEEMHWKVEDCEIYIEFAKDNKIVAKDEQVEVLRHEIFQEKEIEGREQSGAIDEEGLLGDEDDWEGIERSEVEKLFGAAAVFVGSGDHSDRLSKVGGDVQMQLYGLHKVAMEGPCHQPQPMALKVSARAKWNAWQRLGNMSPEVAMEQYLSLLSDCVPGWMEENPGRDSKEDSLEGGISGAQASDLSTFLHHQLGFEERKPEQFQSSVDIGDAVRDPHYVNRGLC